MNKFEQLIEYVINDEDQKARELFHDIVVAKSREIYENIMAEEAEELDETKDEELDEAKHEEELDETKDEELDEAKHEEELDEADEMDESMDMDEAAMGGDAQDDLIDEVETDEEQDMSMEGEGEEEDDMGGSGEPATKDDIMDLEAKLDELMAEFEKHMGDDMGDNMGDGDDFGADEGGDAIEVDDTEEMMPMAEAVTLKAAPKPTTSEEGSVNKKSTVAANSGATGMAGSPVKPTGTEAKGRPAPTTKDLIGDFQNKAGASMKDLTPATKPHLAQATGVNTKSPLPGGRKG